MTLISDEQLICPTEVEFIVSKRLIVSNFPLIHMTDILNSSEEFISNFDFPAPKPSFFKWAITSSSEAGIPVVFYCFNLSLELFDPPPWMRVVLQELKIPYKILSEEN